MVLIILVNFNGADDTIECVDSILKSTFQDFLIIIVDNASNENSLQKLYLNLPSFSVVDFKNKQFIHRKNKKYKDNKIILIRSSFNKGFAAGNNIALLYAKFEKISYKYVWILNNDTVICDNTLESLVERMEDETLKTGILGGKLLYYKSNILQGLGGLYNKYTASCFPLGYGEVDCGQYDKSYIEVDYIIGASMFIKKQFIDEVGLMCEDYFLYFEELDWIIRGKNKGWSIKVNPKACIYHKEGASTSDISVSELSDKCKVKNRLIFTARYYPWYLFTVIPVIFISVLNRLLRGQMHRAIIIFITIWTSLFSICKKAIYK